MIDLRWQYVSLGRGKTDPIFAINNLTRLDAMPSGVDKEFVADYTYGTEIQIANFYSSKVKCKATGSREATEIHTKLSGQATDIDCEHFNNSVVQGRSKWVMLQEYGIAIMLEKTSSSQKGISRIVDING
ncbi:MAG TPA: hypothetical protein VFK88_09615 [Gallionella sp.]|nr:hypothetical protein [Gallionella sp.]